MGRIEDLVAHLVQNDARKRAHMDHHVAVIQTDDIRAIRASNAEWDRLNDEREDVIASLIVYGRTCGAHDTVPCPPPSAHDMAHDAIDACDRVLASSRRMRAAGVAR